jgi:hypothetical protein
MWTNRPIALAVIFALAGLGGSAFAQETGKTPSKPAAAKSLKITVVGQIVKDESMGGYYIQGRRPREIFRILNQNPKVLEGYATSGKEVTIEARSQLGDNLVIENIEGEQYQEAGSK